jgi:hypothetical protein
MKNKVRLIFALGLSVLLFACRKECNINDDYKYYTCSDGFEILQDCSTKKVAWITLDTCEYAIANGCAVKVYDTTSYFQKVEPGLYHYYDSTDCFWDFESYFVVGLSFKTDYGLKSYSSIFVCVNNQTKEILIRCQYEVSDQCAGSEIEALPISYWISIKKRYQDYELIFSIVNSNPI